MADHRGRAGMVVGLLATAMLLVAGGCGEDDDAPSGPDPNEPVTFSVPSIRTMQVEIDDLGRQGIAGREKGLCHALTALTVAWINLNVEARLLVPQAALVACLQQPSVYLGSATWRWTASGGQGAGAWTAELTGRVATATMIAWEMRVSGTTLGLDRFLWFEGDANTEAEAGVWTFYEPGGSTPGQAILEATWVLPAATDEDRTLDFRNLLAGSPDYGDHLHYELADSVAAVSLLDAGTASTLRAQWDLRDGAGFAVNAEQDTCCWGARPTYPDIGCR